MELLQHISLAEFTSFKIGGKADYFCRAQSVDELKEALAFAKEQSLPFFILGGGTNMLLSDDGFRGLVIKIEIKNSPLEGSTPTQVGGRDVLIAVDAGENWDEFVAETVARGLWGLENLSGIPGTVGGAPVQNIGAYGSEVKDVVLLVEVLDVKTGKIKKLSDTECCFGYRDSIFKKPEGKNFIITRVAFLLRKDGKPNLSYKDLAVYFAGKPVPSLADIRRAVLEIRSRKFPDLKTHGTAGSFFKNPIISKEKFDELKKCYPGLPGFTIDERHQMFEANPASSAGRRRGDNIGGRSLVKVPLAWILDNICGLKGFQRGSVSLWKDQPLVLVNDGGASASDISALADKVTRIVKEKTGIQIEKEVQTAPDV
ncbi:MAG: UDP-N-acetylmuramate dehydrogenase [Parcubacteria group bacterium Gr01-1014_17]|nr:MAG: UDP-N-acetylmuramate dehydrogenase [Parcubacteria group bacterium Gr01-1014_17]